MGLRCVLINTIVKGHIQYVRNKTQGSSWLLSENIRLTFVFYTSLFTVFVNERINHSISVTN